MLNNFLNLIKILNINFGLFMLSLYLEIVFLKYNDKGLIWREFFVDVIRMKEK